MDLIFWWFTVGGILICVLKFDSDNKKPIKSLFLTLKIRKN